MDFWEIFSSLLSALYFFQSAMNLLFSYLVKKKYKGYKIKEIIHTVRHLLNMVENVEENDKK